MNIGNLLVRNAFDNADKEAVIFEDKRFTYKEFNNRVNQFANALLGMGYKKGDIIANWLGNCNEFMEVYYAIAKIGAIMFPVNPMLAPKDILYLLQWSDSQLLIFGEAFKDQVKTLRSELPGISKYIYVGEKKLTPPDALNYESLLEKNGDKEPSIEVLEDDNLIFLSTGGTTGLPKLVVLSHKAAIWIAVDMLIDVGYRGDDITLNSMPLFHGACLGIWFNPHMYLGATQVIMKGFNPEEYLKLIDREKVTSLFFMPPVLHSRLIQVPGYEKYDVNSIRILYTAGAAFPQKIRDQIQSHMKNARIHYIYGLSEMGPNGSVLKPKDAGSRLGSCGRLVASVEWKIVDDQDNELPRGQVGELLLRGPSMMKEYYKRPEETKAGLKNGWVHTGDLLKADREGWLYFVDRKKDMIKSGGENVYAKTVEDCLYTHPDIADVAVIGVPDEQWGEAVKAIVVLRKGAETVKEKDIIDFCKKNLARFAVPKSIDFVSDLPRNPSGKVLKPELRKIYVK